LIRPQDLESERDAPGYLAEPAMATTVGPSDVDVMEPVPS
jgi:hypothetical protein